MKMKRLIVFAIAGTLSLSNAAWADTDRAAAGTTETTVEATAKTGEQKQRKAQTEVKTNVAAETKADMKTAEKLATPSNAEREIPTTQNTASPGAASGDDTKQDVEITGIKLEVPDTAINPGKTYKLKFTVEPADIADDVIKTAKWTSTVPEVASVDENGLVTGHATGYTSIRVNLGGKTDTCKIQVKNPLVTKATVLADGNEKVLNLAETGFFRADDGVKAVKVKSLPDEAKKYFDGTPSADGMSVRFKLKPSAQEFQVDIPLSVSGDKYNEYNNDCVLTITAQPTVYVASRTEAQIREFLSKHPFNENGSDSWDTAPNPSKEIAGKLSAASVTNALNALNFVRYVAGIPSDVTNNQEYEQMAQTGTTLLQRINGGLDHTPKKPEGVSAEFYDLGYKGTSSSNLGQGYRNLVHAVLGGWMEDGDKGNIDRVGHRRWCLNPEMKQTGFGHSGAYTAMYSFDDGYKEQIPAYNYVSWPGQTMPVSYFRGPWSISLNPQIFDGKKSKENVSVTMNCNGKSYTLNKDNKDVAGKYLNLDTVGYGYGPAVIFQPGVWFKAGDTVSVKVAGLKDRYGNEIPIEYSVKFFSIEVKNLESIKLNTASASVTLDDTYQLKVTMVPANATNASLSDVKWSSSNTKVATVSSKGIVSANAVGSAKITAELNGKTATCTIYVRKYSSSSSGGSSGGGSYTVGGSSRSGGGSTTGGPSGSLPSYVVKGNWTQANNGTWRFTDSSGQQYKNKWAAVSNPYAKTSAGQSSFDWFFFDGEGNMLTGWHQDTDGNRYYLNPDSDGTRGRMMTGWVWIPDAQGVRRCYYLNPVSDGTRGKMLSNTVVEGYTVNAEGQWVVNGVVQTK